MYKVHFATAAVVVSIFSLIISTNSGNAKVICVDKHNYTTVIPCSDENAIDKDSLMTRHILTSSKTANLTSFNTTTLKKLVPYENREVGFEVLYPSGWHIVYGWCSTSCDTFNLTSDRGPGSNDTRYEISFGPAGYIESYANGSWGNYVNTSLSVEVKNVSKYLDTSTLTLKTHTAYDYAHPNLEMPYVRDMPVTVGPAHIPGWRVDSVSRSGGICGYGNGCYDASVYIVANGREYTFTYEDDPLKVSATLPIMQTMLNSFQIIK